jgi:hypothetical protein
MVQDKTTTAAVVGQPPRIEKPREDFPRDTAPRAGRETIGDDRLRAVVEHVREWLSSKRKAKYSAARRG